MKVWWVLLGAVCLLLATLWIRAMVRMPGKSHSGPLAPLTEGERAIGRQLEIHVNALAGDIGERNMWSFDGLQKAAVYIEDTLIDIGYDVSPQVYTVEGRDVRNLVVDIEGSSQPGEIVLIGAHYDSVYGCPGANDNASGVAALLEVARWLAGSNPSRTLRFAAFVNEEPPFFQTSRMGSLVYARAARERGDRIVAALSLETIGYYSDEPGSQDYPPPFGLMYPSSGNFIGFVGNRGSGDLVRRCLLSFRSHTSFPSEGISAPGWMVGIGWSDHWAFWQEGYPAIMVTDTAPFRYEHYHAATDTPHRLVYDRMARVVAGLVRVTAELAGAEIRKSAP